MNTRQATNLQQIPPALQADCCLICMSVANDLVLHLFATMNEDGCCWLLCLGARPAAVCFEHAPQLQNNIVVSLPSPSPNSWLLHPPSRLFIKSIRAGLGPIVSLVPPPEHILCWRAAQTCHRPIFVLLRMLFFLWPRSKIDGLDGNEGKGRHQWWCWMALVAIARWLGGHQTWFLVVNQWLMDVFVVSYAWKKYGTWYVLSQKKSRLAQLTFIKSI
jgi:hypothetical protein